MRYTIRRISLRSTLKVGLLLGWVLALLPALALAAAAMLGLQSVAELFGGVQSYDISVLGQNIATLDLLELLGLADEASRVTDLADLGWGLFGTLAFALTLVGGAIVAASALLFSLCYNLLAALFGGLTVDLRETA